MRFAYAFLVLALLTGASSAQPVSEQETYEEIGRQLEEVRKLLQSRETEGVAKAGKVESTLPYASTHNPLQNAGGSHLNEPPRADQSGVGKAFDTSEPKASVPDWISNKLMDIVDGEIEDAMKQLGRLSAYLKNNPHARMKGFTVNISVPPSVEVEFEVPAAPEAVAASPR